MAIHMAISRVPEAALRLRQLKGPVQPAPAGTPHDDCHVRAPWPCHGRWKLRVSDWALLAPVFRYWPAACSCRPSHVATAA